MRLTVERGLPVRAVDASQPAVTPGLMPADSSSAERRSGEGSDDDIKAQGSKARLKAHELNAGPMYVFVGLVPWALCLVP